MAPTNSVHVIAMDLDYLKMCIDLCKSFITGSETNIKLEVLHIHLRKIFLFLSQINQPAPIKLPFLFFALGSARLFVGLTLPQAGAIIAS
jgi:hypothetical protein